jgi:hypothetical protein
MNWVSIDFGTSYSSASVLVDNKPVKVHPIGGLYNMYGFPTVAYVDENKHIRVCNDAMPWRCQNPERFLKDFKLNIHEENIEYLGVKYQDIIREILLCIKRSAEYSLGNDQIEGVILTIPATYSINDPRKQVMYDSAIAAGFKEVEFIKEAEAAAIYYHNLQHGQNGTVTLIYDLGGGTFDPAIVEHTDNGYKLLGYASGKECGGKYFEAALYKYFNKEYTFTFNEDENIRIQQIDGIAKLCKDIKESLSNNDEVSFPVPLMGKTTICITRSKFEDLIKPLLEKTFQECSALVLSAGKQWSNINRILLIGGSSTIPCVKTFFRQYLIGQNQSDIPIIFNKSEEGLFIDTLFAVSIGGLLSHKSKSDPVIEPVERDRFFLLAQNYMNGRMSVPKNWIKAAFFFNKDYCENKREESYNNLMLIYQTILDKLELENGNLIFKSIINDTGEDSVDCLVELLMKLQSNLEQIGYEEFIKQIFDLDYWLPITDSIIKSMNDDRFC